MTEISTWNTQGFYNNVQVWFEYSTWAGRTRSLPWPRPWFNAHNTQTLLKPFKSKILTKATLCMVKWILMKSALSSMQFNFTESCLITLEQIKREMFVRALNTSDPMHVDYDLHIKICENNVKTAWKKWKMHTVLVCFTSAFYSSMKPQCHQCVT